ncbi:MAG: sensor histidine kinase [Anaerolineaceae bacterium]|nr:MAG: sensor histidine kinase [Anaerolineaceae bacterium]
MTIRSPAFLRINSIRFRLLISYLLLLVLTLATIVAAIAVTTGARSAPSQPTWRELTLLVRGLNRENLINEFILSAPDVQEATVAQLIDTYAADTGVRIIRFEIGRDGVPYVVHDSDGIFELGRHLPSHYFDLRQGAPSDQIHLTLPPTLQQVHGAFVEDETEWLFSGVVKQPPPALDGPQDDIEMVGILTATPRPSQSLRGVLNGFGLDSFMPLLQAGGIGLLVAAALAYLSSQYIARPLQSLSEAAQAIAGGDLTHRVPVIGPQETQTLAEAFNDMSDEVRKTQQAQSDFLTNVSHDLKTPLTSIQGYSQSIIDGVKPPHEAAAVIHSESLRLSRMVERLIDLVRMQAGEFQLNLTTLNLSKIAEAVGERLRVVAAEKDIALTIVAPPVPSVRGDGDRLVQVLDNLIGNAIKYIDEGGEIYVETREMPDGVQLIVTDNGEGISSEDMERIFERFYRIDPARQSKHGVGLGLSITREIVHLHGGTIDVQSVEGRRGTRFIVWLPFNQQD